MGKLTNERENGSSQQLDNLQDNLHGDSVDVNSEDTAHKKETQYKIRAKLNEEQMDDDFDKCDTTSEIDETPEYSQKFIQAMYEMVKERYGEEAGQKIVQVAEEANEEKRASRAQHEQLKNTSFTHHQVSESSYQDGDNHIAGQQPNQPIEETPILSFTGKLKKFRFQVAAAVIALAVGGILCKTGVQATRLPKADIVEEVSKDNSKIGSPEDLISTLDMINYPDTLEKMYEPSVVLEGYTEAEGSNRTRKAIMLSYDNETGKWYRYQQMTIGANSFLDTEKANWQKIYLQDFLGFYILDEEVSKLWWFDYEYSYQIVGTLSKDEMLNLAESLVEVKE